MSRLGTWVFVGTMISIATIVAACTTTNSQRNPTADLNSACALGFNNDRPCSY